MLADGWLLACVEAAEQEWRSWRDAKRAVFPSDEEFRLAKPAPCLRKRRWMVGDADKVTHALALLAAESWNCDERGDAIRSAVADARRALDRIRAEAKREERDRIAEHCRGELQEAHNLGTSGYGELSRLIQYLEASDG